MVTPCFGHRKTNSCAGSSMRCQCASLLPLVISCVGNGRADQVWWLVGPHGWIKQRWTEWVVLLPRNPEGKWRHAVLIPAVAGEASKKWPCRISFYKTLDTSFIVNGCAVLKRFRNGKWSRPPRTCSWHECLTLVQVVWEKPKYWDRGFPRSRVIVAEAALLFLVVVASLLLSLRLDYCFLCALWDLHAGAQDWQAMD